MFNRLHRMTALIMVMSLLGVILAACGGDTGGAGGTGNTAASTPGGAASAAVEPSMAAEPSMAPSAAASAGGEASMAPSAAASAGGEASMAPSAAASAGGAAGASAAAGGTGGQTAAAECPASAQGQQITMWSPLTGPDGDEMTALATRFSGENAQGIKVSHVAQPQYLEKLTTAAAGGTLPQMTVIRTYDMPEMALRNVLKPMSEETLAIIGAGSGEEFPTAAWEAGEFRDQRYMVPLDIHPTVLYYNKDMFQQAGITMPTDRPMTTEEFDAAVTALTKDGVAGVSIGTAFQTAMLFQTIIRQLGGSLVNEDGTEAAYNSEQGVQAAQYIQALKAKTTPQVNGAGDPEVKVFQQQKAAMVFHGPWHISDMQKLPFVGFAQLPQFAGNEYTVWGNSHQLALATDDPAQQAAAGCWISWLSQNSVEWAKAGQVPARASARNSDELATVMPAVAAFAAEAETVQFLPQVPGIEAAVAGQGFEPALNDLLLGKIQPDGIKAALDAQVAKSNQLLQQNAEKYKQQ